MNSNTIDLPTDLKPAMVIAPEPNGAEPRTSAMTRLEGPEATTALPEDLLEMPMEGPGPRISQDLRALGIKELVVLSSPGSLSLYSRDQADVADLLRTILFQSRPDAVVQPFSLEAVVAVLRFASSQDTPVIVRGAGSSPFGGSVPVKGGIVMDMSTLDRILAFDPVRRTVEVQAGMRWSDLDWFLEGHGLSVRSSPSSRFSTVGGWVSTGGIGIDSLSGGHLSSSVLKLKVVVPDGRTLEVRPDDPLFRPMFGSEGRLGVVYSVTLLVKDRPRLPSPRLVLFPECAVAIRYAQSLASSKQAPLDCTYLSPGKLEGLNRLLGKEYFPVAHGVLYTIDSSAHSETAHSVSVPREGRMAPPHLAHLLYHERYFPMKLRRLGPGLMGAEVLAPRTPMADIVERAERVCSLHGLEPMIEVHMLRGGDGLLLCYYLTNQSRTLRYTMDSFRGLLISSALMEAGARPYSFGIWNHSFSDQVSRDEGQEMERAKAELDPSDIMNRGKYPRLGGRLAGAPAALFSPVVLGSALRLFNMMGPLSAQAVKLVSSGRAFDRDDAGDALLRAADECSMCGACVSVCPSYQITRDERVTARGKLLLARALTEGQAVSQEHARRAFLCMRCKACEQVCQSKLRLMPAYDELERRLEALHGRDGEEIQRFVHMVEKSSSYDSLVARGLVLGAPARTSDGGD